MTFADAMKQAKDGHRVREANFSKGWTIGYFRGAKDFFCINPHTGGNYLFSPTAAHKASTNWTVVS